MVGRYLFILSILLLLACESETEDKTENYTTPFELSDGTESATYEQAIELYMELAKEFPQVHIQTIGETDSGFPLHFVTYNKDAEFNYQKLAEEKTVILVNNGIHPGESDGIDASLLLFRDLAVEKLAPPENVVLITIPVYNIGGALNRSQKTRVNQNGPAVQGFRGNARNYDLNRDFIKADTKNSRTFSEIFHLVQPDIFVDTHVSNGADYQYTVSHLFTQPDKLGGKAGEFLEEKMIPDLESRMEIMGQSVTPYVNIFNKPPDNGFSQFLDHPRYSTGYAALWNAFGLMIETHMLKPYDKRVKATYDFISAILDFAQAEHEQIKSIRQAARTRHQQWSSYPVKWALDSTKYRKLNFEGFRADTIPSSITGKNRLKYRQDEPFTREIAYYNSYSPLDSVAIPEAYVISKEWEEVIDLLSLNRVGFSELQNDTIMEVESYRIGAYKTYPNSYEGHYPHYETEVESSKVRRQFQQGDILVPTDQYGIRYILEVLEPMAPDSFFNWNFFDPILQRKEGFSPYVFEDLANEILESNTVLRDSFYARKERDKTFNDDAQAQLNWIYRQSDYYERSHLQYPVYRIMKDADRTDSMPVAEK